MNGEVMVVIVYDRAIDEEIIDMLEGLDIQHYTKWKDTRGVGRHDPHLGDEVWPGLNNVVLAVIDDAKKDKLLKLIRALQASFASVGLRAFVVPVLNMV